MALLTGSYDFDAYDSTLIRHAKALLGLQLKLHH